MAVKTVAALLRERDAVKKSGMRADLVDRVVADIDRQIEEMASQLPLPLKTGGVGGGAGDGAVAAPGAAGAGKSK